MTFLETVGLAWLTFNTAGELGALAMLLIPFRADVEEHEGATEAYGAELMDQRREALTGEQTVVIDLVPVAPLPYPHIGEPPTFDQGLLSLTREWPRDWLEQKIRAAEEQAEQAGLVTR